MMTRTTDAFLAGRVQVIQPAKGFRAGMDSVMLAASLHAAEGEVLVEAGCGAGAALLCAAARLAHARLIGIEQDADLAGLAQEGIALNGFDGRVEVRTGDVADRGAVAENAADQAFANPPYFQPGATSPPGEGKAAAYVAGVSLKSWVLFLLHAVKPGGRVTLIHRAQALGDLLELLNPRTGEIEVLPIHPSPGAAAKRVLVRARKGLRKGALTLYTGLVLHEAEGGPLTQRARAALEGGELDWRQDRPWV
ncbi:methyltransferase [bacterium]|nr:methyltransferase [bacterium]